MTMYYEKRTRNIKQREVDDDDDDKSKVSKLSPSTKSSSLPSSSHSSSSQVRKRMKHVISNQGIFFIIVGMILFIFLFVTLQTFFHIHSINNDTSKENTMLLSNKDSILPMGYTIVDQDVAQDEDGEERSEQHNIVKVDEIRTIEQLQSTFPVHAKHDVEQIIHPGIFMSHKNDFITVLQDHSDLLIKHTKIFVPKFWRPNIVYNTLIKERQEKQQEHVTNDGRSGSGGVREYLGEYGKRLITPEEAANIGSFYEKKNNGTVVDGHGSTSYKGSTESLLLETIYISVASYRDPECRPTVEDAFLRAEYPERIRMAIINQRAKEDDELVEDTGSDKKENGTEATTSTTVLPSCYKPEMPCDTHPEQVFCKYQHLIDVYELPAELSIGPVFARHLAHRMYRGEYFAMQLDSHVRFIKHWDTDIISQWKSTKNEMAVLTVYLSDLIDSIDPITHESKRTTRPIMCVTRYEDQGKMRHLRHGKQPEGPSPVQGEPQLEPLWAAGFSFARGHFVVQVPYDQYQPMVFQGEEISIGLRGFTFGYDYYAPERSVCFHMYAVRENESKRKKVKVFWENKQFYPGAAVEGMKRLNGILGMGDTSEYDYDPETEYYHGEEEEYGLGHVRDKDIFFKLYGINTTTKEVEDNLCSFVDSKAMMELFQPALRTNRMGLDLDLIDFSFVDPKKKK